MKSIKLQNMELAKRLHDRAANNLINAVKEAFPIGSEVSATIGRSRFHGIVEGYWSAWYQQDYINVRNVKTGKLRKVCVTYDGNDVRRTE